ncbi:aspartate racemase [Kurthia zopfii]|uniref:Aspartate racemase n=1 Tax=Kurthia zopfii TaxID=1650 RepID=A0A8B4QDJ0_9BACL|nr:amino acid racemase [Kurthia zopfii]PWI22452.1 aspartate racemase [Kurthia zopfii]TDR38823.1 aspartate racemase [Kurthia zopfii]GEK31746.1 aspartate racemase [Kurthia zopfii]STX10729.1 Aspartate racemase [Kurthia zopfii]
MNKKTLGIIGGVGPLATMLLGEMIVKRTKASADQEHMHFIIDNDTRIPDRTAYILDREQPNPLPVMIQDAGKLVSVGVDVICVPCNTAHYFYDELADNTAVPILHMIRETANKVKSLQAKKVGILGTKGTLSTNLYQDSLREVGIEPVVPDDAVQDLLMEIIYDYVKAGSSITREMWSKVEDAIMAQGCDHVILGCTELSIVNRELSLDQDTRYVDALVTLADRTIEYCGYELAQKNAVNR